MKTLRKRLFGPTLSFDDLDSLNHYLAKQCHELMNEFKHPDNKAMTVLASFNLEKTKLISTQPFHWYKSQWVRVNRLSLVNYQNHRYSVPCRLANKKVLLQIYANHINVIEKQECVATHVRSFIKNETSYNPWHYLNILKQKPGALRNGEPFFGWKLPESIKTLQRYLLKKPKGDRAMVELLTLIAEYGEDVGITAAEIALEEKVPTVEAVHNIINRLLEPVPPILKIKEIPLNTPPQSNCQRYNTLLTGVHDATS